MSPFCYLFPICNHSHHPILHLPIVTCICTSVPASKQVPIPISSHHPSLNTNLQHVLHSVQILTACSDAQPRSPQAYTHKSPPSPRLASFSSFPRCHAFISHQSYSCHAPAPDNQQKENKIFTPSIHPAIHPSTTTTFLLVYPSHPPTTPPFE
ncbi:hypothetical protein DM02DRAFT_339999 [Periconia macrospinosa]|uniref:Uncharacterized protein n=1 Tax=Periconia macrospinosa TaxID=97972 RepID=A0A2V1DUH1_9PLEO|nr:hypothetical protein DM02DRAFT_339999 [Periconia macrospinosa]